MAKQLIYSLFIVALVAPFCASQGQDMQFQAFLENTMQNYSSWVASKDLDPTPPTKGVVYLERESLVLKCTGTITNQTLLDHSDVSKITVESQYSEKQIYLTLESGFRALGVYNLDGTAYPDSSLATPVSGRGGFSINTVDSRMKAGISIIDFTIRSDHIDLSTATITYNKTNTAIFYEKSSYEGLEAGMFAEEVAVDLRVPYDNQLSEWLPVIDYVTAYLAKTFAEHPVSEIVGR